MPKNKSKHFFRSRKVSPVTISAGRSVTNQLSLAVIGLSVLIVSLQPVYHPAPIQRPIPTPSVQAASVTRLFLPVNSSQTPPPKLTARAYFIQDPVSGTVLVSQNPDLRLLPASTTKITTALVALSSYRLDDIVTVGSVGNGQTPQLVTGEKITVENLLYAMLLNSDNDAALALANFDPLGYAHFVSLMNQKVQSLGLVNTHFTNPAGFDHPDHYSTVSDLARIGTYAMSQPLFSRIVGTKISEIFSADQKHKHLLSNLNELLGEIPGVRGIKTGFTEAAGQNLVTDVVRDGRELIFVVLGSTDRFGESKSLVNWAFSNFVWQDQSPQIIGTIESGSM